MSKILNNLTVEKSLVVDTNKTLGCSVTIESGSGSAELINYLKVPANNALSLGYNSAVLIKSNGDVDILGDLNAPVIMQDGSVVWDESSLIGKRMEHNHGTGTADVFVKFKDDTGELVSSTLTETVIPDFGTMININGMLNVSTTEGGGICGADIGLFGDLDTTNIITKSLTVNAGPTNIVGSVNMSTMTKATVDTDRFMVFQSGYIRYRTGDEVRSDIGASPVSPIAINTIPKSNHATAGTFVNSSIVDDGTQVLIHSTASNNPLRLKSTAYGVNSKTGIEFENTGGGIVTLSTQNTEDLYINGNEDRILTTADIDMLAPRLTSLEVDTSLKIITDETSGAAVTINSYYNDICQIYTEDGNALYIGTSSNLIQISDDGVTFGTGTVYATEIDTEELVVDSLYINDRIILAESLDVDLSAGSQTKAPSYPVYVITVGHNTNTLTLGTTNIEVGQELTIVRGFDAGPLSCMIVCAHNTYNLLDSYQAAKFIYMGETLGWCKYS